MPASPPNSWGPEMDAYLTERWGKESASIIADGIVAKRLARVSRNGVIGRARRLGLKQLQEARRKGDTPRKLVKPNNPKTKKPKQPKQPRSKKKLPPTFVELVSPDAPPSLNVPLLDLMPEHCRFIAGDDYLFCGQNKQEGSSYCPYHTQLCWRAPEDRKPPAQRAFGKAA